MLASDSSDFDATPGKWEDQAYDSVQRNILVDHVAAGVPVGRCRSPYCGIAVDSLIRKVALDPEETENFIHIPVDDAADFVEDSFRTIDIDVDKGIKAVVGKLKSNPEGSTHIQKFLFDKSKDWTMEKAQAWIEDRSIVSHSECARTTNHKSNILGTYEGFKPRCQLAANRENSHANNNSAKGNDSRDRPDCREVSYL